ncbi:MAG: hypothetical protein CSA66_04700 [Proteobacteria bacterium]|nr:MAG: hypothetical protein CSA66_04700 [Pseudomonadota bacterium]
MSEDNGQDPGKTEREGTASEAQAEGLAAGTAARGTDAGDRGPIGVLEDAINKAGSRWLKDRFQLVEDEDGTLHIPGADKMQGLGERAQSFVHGFLRGFFNKTPEQLEAEAGLRDPEDVPRSSEVVAALFAKLSHTVTDTWKGYVHEHAEQREGDQVVVDGDFIVHHGAGFIGTMIHALGEAFKDQGRAPDPGVVVESGPVAGPDPTSLNGQTDAQLAEGEEATAQAASDAPKIDIKVDVASIFRSLFTPRS